MRVAALVASERWSTSATRTSSEASVCCRRPLPPTLGAPAVSAPPPARAGTADPIPLRSSASSRSGAITSVADIFDPLFQSSQRAAQAGRARRLADPEDPRGARPVELEQDA